MSKGDVFWVLKGARFDGHDFLAEALAKASPLVVLSNPKRLPPQNGLKFQSVVFGNTLESYGDFARWYRHRFKIPAIAITGSSGKTTVKELVSHLLCACFKVLKNQGTENNLVGVPKTLLALDASQEVLVLEMGTNAPGEIARLSAIIGPQVAVITQIGHGHLEGLKNIEGVREEKLSLLKYLERGGKLVVCGEDPALRKVESGAHHVVRCGFSNGNEVVARDFHYDEQGSVFWIGEQGPFRTQLLGRHNILNALLAIAVARSLGVEMDVIRERLADFKPVPGRLTVKTIDGIQFIDDSYNSNPDSFGAALETLKEYKSAGRKIVVCADMLELGDEKEAWHRKLGTLLAETRVDFIVAAGTLSRLLLEEVVKSGFSADRIRYTEDSAEAGRACRAWAKPGDTVLVKGSRGMKMERVMDCFTNSCTP